MHAVHLNLIAKRVVDFLLVIGLIELFSLCVTDESLRTNIDRKLALSLQRGLFDRLKCQVEGVPPTIRSSCF